VGIGIFLAKDAPVGIDSSARSLQFNVSLGSVGLSAGENPAQHRREHGTGQGNDRNHQQSLAEIGIHGIYLNTI
jgi:hypothetical protein